MDYEWLITNRVIKFDKLFIVTHYKFKQKNKKEIKGVSNLKVAEPIS